MVCLLACFRIIVNFDLKNELERQVKMVHFNQVSNGPGKPLKGRDLSVGSTLALPSSLLPPTVSFESVLAFVRVGLPGAHFAS